MHRHEPPPETANLALWDEYVGLVRQRMEQGERDYQGRSFGLPVDATVAEIEQELLDVFGWGYIAWRRIQAAKSALAEKLQGSDNER